MTSSSVTFDKLSWESSLGIGVFLAIPLQTSLLEHREGLSPEFSSFHTLDPPSRNSVIAHNSPTEIQTSHFNSRSQVFFSSAAHLIHPKEFTTPHHFFSSLSCDVF